MGNGAWQGRVDRRADALVSNMAESVRTHELPASLLSEGIAEGVVRANYCGVACQIRMDWFEPHQGIVDLKTCDDLTWFEADARRFGYGHQVAFYRAVLRRCSASPCRCTSSPSRSESRIARACGRSRTIRSPPRSEKTKQRSSDSSGVRRPAYGPQATRSAASSTMSARSRQQDQSQASAEAQRKVL